MRSYAVFTGSGVGADAATATLGTNSSMVASHTTEDT